MSKEACVIVYDQSLSMKNQSEETINLGKECLKMMLKGKMINSPKDEIGLVKIGTKETDNHLNEENEDEYLNCVEVQPLIPIRFELFSVIDEIEIGDESHSNSDILEGVIVAFDMIFRKCGKKKSFTKKIILLTDGRGELDSYEMKKVAKNLQMNNITFLVLGVGFSNVSCTSECQLLLKEMVDLMEKNVSWIKSVEAVFESMSVVQKKKKKFRGMGFEMSLCGDELVLPIQRYKKSEKTVFPKTQKYSKKSLQLEDQSHLTGKIKTSRAYFMLDDPDRQVNLENTIKAYKYGKNLVPVSKVDEEALKFRSTKSFEILGFVPEKDIKRIHHMKESYCICVKKGASEDEQKTFSLLVRALFELGYVAIVRMVYRKNSSPTLRVLYPRSKDEVGEYFYANELPFNEDIREYDYKSLNDVELTDNQLTAAEELINSLDLMNITEDGKTGEALKPKNVYSPVNQYFYDCVNYRALNEDSNLLPEVNPVIMKKFLPDLSNNSFYPKMVRDSSEKIEQFKELFPLVKVEKRGKKRPFFWFSNDRSTFQTQDEGQPNKRQKTGDGDGEEVHLFTSQVKKVTTSDPIGDFKSIIEEDDRNLGVAMNQMEAAIFVIIDNSVKNINYEKGFKCIEYCRSVCLEKGKAETIKFLNEMLKKVKHKYGKKEEIHYEFWNLIKQKSLTFITKSENVLSEITEEEGKQFLSDVVVEEVSIIEEVEPEEDDMFDDLD